MWARAYTYISTMAYVMQGAADTKRDLGARSPESDRRDDHRRARARTRIQVVRRALSDPDAAWHDRRRTCTLFNDASESAQAAGRSDERLASFDLWAETGLQWIRPRRTSQRGRRRSLVRDRLARIGGTSTTASGIPWPFPMPVRPAIDGAKFAARSIARSPRCQVRPGRRESPPVGFWDSTSLRASQLGVTGPHAFYAVRTAVEMLVAARELIPTPSQLRTATSRSRLGNGFDPHRAACGKERVRDSRAVGGTDRRVRSDAAPVPALRVTRRESARTANRGDRPRCGQDSARGPRGLRLRRVYRERCAVGRRAARFHTRRRARS